MTLHFTMSNPPGSEELSENTVISSIARELRLACQAEARGSCARLRPDGLRRGILRS
jgi:hypothetical protein